MADISTGRMHDGQPRLVTLPDPTPRAPNDIAICGSRRYSSLDPTTQTLNLQLLGTPGLSKTVTFRASGSVLGGNCALFISAIADEVSLGGLSTAQLLISPINIIAVSQPTGAGGVTDFPLTIPNEAALIGDLFYFQAWSIGAGALAGSTGLEIKVCQ